MKLLTTRRHKVIAAATLGLILIGTGLWWQKSRSAHWRQGLVYTREGYGGYVPKAAVRKARTNDPLRPMVDAYNAGRYADAEVEALRLINSTAGSKKPTERKYSVRARYVLAFAAARRKDMRLARERFSILKEEAAKLPDKGKQSSQPGIVTPTLEEQGAYQHAVCTAALGDKEAAEAEYMKFMHDYPESPLIHGALQRIERLHDGHLPAEAEAAWTGATKIAQARERGRQKARLRERALCGPECLAELLRRHGKKADVHALAAEMKTSEFGTSLQALADAAKKHGFSAKGLALTQKGLLKQPLPLVALVMPGHYVVVDAVSPGEVTVWDAHGSSTGKPATRRYSVKEWSVLWSSGIALVVQPGELTRPARQ